MVLFVTRFHFYLPVSVLDCSPILSTFQVILLEHIIMCRLVTGHKATALQEVYCFCIHGFVVYNMWQCEEDAVQQHGTKSEHWLSVLSIQISQVCQLCQQSPRLFTNHAAQLHTLLVSIFNIICVCLRVIFANQDMEGEEEHTLELRRCWLGCKKREKLQTRSHDANIYSF